ncbi:transcriptional regulator [Aeromicrobium sp. Root236]|nr:transcriptional regulator [Aeromicrobium sp. Root236]
MTSSPGSVHYRVSGGVTVLIDGTPVGVGGPKQRRVLAVLLSRVGTVVTISQVVDAVWGDAPPAKAPVSVRSYVTNLRRVLHADGVERLHSGPLGYRLELRDGDSVDLMEFEDLATSGREALVRLDVRTASDQLTEALSRWVGPPYGELADADFIRPDVVRLAALHDTAQEAWFDACLQLGRDSDLVPELESAVARSPLQERLWGHLMLALHRSGRHADALLAYDRAREVLDREIGSRPGEGIRALLAKIQAHDPELRVTPARTTREASDAHRIVGRDSELDSLRETSAGLTMITGESGIGKTALAQAAFTSAQETGRPAAWAAHPAGVGLPALWTWIQVLRQLGEQLGPDARRAVIRDAPGAVDAIVPEWNETPPSGRLGATGFALVEGVVTALRSLASRAPVLLVLDDLHHADDETYDVLILLLAQFPRLPVTVIATWTFYGDGRPMNRQGFDRTLRSSSPGSMHLSGLDRGPATELVESIIGSGMGPQAADKVWRETGGNPLYLQEVARTIAESGHDAPVSHTVLGVLDHRLGELAEGTRRLLGTAAVMGVEIDVAGLSDVLDVPVSRVHEDLAPAYLAGLLDEVGDRPGDYRFSHGLVRDALLARQDVAARTVVHATIARLGASSVTTAAYERAVALADHAWRAGPELDAETAVTIIDAVVQRALGRSRYADVADLAERAVQICARLTPTPDGLDREAMLWLHLAGARTILHGQTDEAAGVAIRRAFEIGEASKGRGYYSAAAMHCLMLCGTGRLDEAEAIARGLREEYESSDARDVGEVSDLADIMISVLRGDVDRLVAAGRHMMTTFPAPETVTDPLHFFHPRALCWMAIGEASRGDEAASRRYLAEAIELTQSRGDVFSALVNSVAEIEIAAILGITDGTAERAAEVDKAFRAAGSDQWAAVARIIELWAQTLQNTAIDLGPEAARAFEEYTIDGTTAATSMLRCLLADIESHHGRSESALSILARAERVAEVTGERVWDPMIAARRELLTSSP